MFVETRLWENDDDYKKLIQNLEPPPPPGSDNLWELHFCKWWGWNWVKKREVVEAPMQRSTAPKPLEQKKVEKKPIKHLCQSLCFKKKKNQKPLQDRYNTPSNSVIENRNQNKKSPTNSVSEVDTKKVQTIKNTNGTYPNTVHDNDRTDSVVQREVEEQITKDVRNKGYASPLMRPPAKKKKMIKRESSTSFSQEESSSHYKDKGRSSTEESTEYINITCSCCHSRQSPPAKKCTNEKCTQDTQPDCKMISTQTEQREKKHRRRRICVICCCNCRQNYSPSCCPCCSCDNIRKREKSNCPGPESTEQAFHKSEAPVLERQRKPVTTYRASYDPGSVFQKETRVSKQPNHLTKKFEPIYVTGMPIDTMLYHNKPITKFGIPSRSYSWIHTTKSDIFDQFSHSRMNCEFSSPVSGKSYNLSPIKLHDPESEPSGIFNPMSIDEELENLKKIGDDIKMDLKSRVMLDAVCDAILAKDKEPDASSSLFLNEFTYPNVAQTECVMTDLFKPERKNTCPKLNQTGLERIIFEDVSNKVNCETNTSNASLNRDSNSLCDYLNLPSQQTYTLENTYRKVLHNPCISLNYNLQREQQRLTPTENAFLTNHPLVATQRQPIFARPKLTSTAKRSASPSPKGGDIKKVKLGEPSTLENVSDIFKKIDQIILKSKVNNEEIQSVLNTIPKSTYKFFTSWEVSNLINQNIPLQNVDREGFVDPCVNAIGEDKKEKNGKTKTPQTKKKNVYNRPSMIPKRVIDSRLNNKKNMS